MSIISKCSCTGNNLDKLIQPVLLTVLAEEDLYGYKIVHKMSQMPIFRGRKPDVTGVYRSLKSMETRGLVVSSWNVSDAGSAKRFYKLTESGVECLNRWIETLEEHRQTIGTILTEAKKVSAKIRLGSSVNKT